MILLRRKTLGSIFAVLATAAALASPPKTGEPHFIEVDGAKVHYTNYGEGGMALVFVHGWSCDETVWNGQALALAEKIRTITIDLPGHGQSDKPRVAYTMELYARAMFMVLRDANVQSATVVAHSNGTPAIRQLYRQFPTKVDALVNLDGGLRPFVDAASMDKFIAPLRGDHYEEAASKFIDGMTQPIADEKLRDRIETLMLRTPQYVAVSEFEKTADPALWKPDKIDVPVLMILAKQPMWTSEYEQFVRTLVPKLNYQVWDNVSHFIMIEKPQEFNEALLRFLETNRLLPESS